MLPNKLKHRLERKRWYLRIRYSKAVLGVWLALRPGVRREIGRQVGCYLTLLHGKSSILIFDIGANEGFLSASFAAAGHRVIAVEPSKRNIAILRERFRDDKLVTIEEQAVSDSEGLHSFYESDQGHAYGTLSTKWKDIAHTSNLVESTVPVTTLDRLIETHGQPDFIKIDVEGHERSVVRGLTRRVQLISFEAILPLFMDETRACLGHLVSIDASARFNFSYNNELMLLDFVEAEELLSRISVLPSMTIEVFCRMA